MTSKINFFGKTGIEPTFYPSYKVQEPYYDNGKSTCWWTEFYSKIISRFIGYDGSCRPERIKHSWAYSENDDGVLEIPTKVEFDTKEKLLSAFNELQAYLDQFYMKPSSLIDMYSEGGCHINVDLSKIPFISLYDENSTGSTEADNKKRFAFFDNLINFLNENPSLIWLYDAPNDDISAKVIVRQISHGFDTEKGDCINLRDYRSAEYVEFRFLMMPRSTGELSHHLDVVHSIMNYVYDKTEKGIKFKRKNNKSSLRKYTLDKAKSEAVSILSELGIDVAEVKKFGKFNLMKERFSLGKEYLV